MDNQNYLNKDQLGMVLAISVSLSSKDPNTKVGSVILDKDKRVVSLGYNGFPSGYPDIDENWARPKKYDIVIHAEMNAILNNKKTITKDMVLYTTLYPCSSCAKHICATGIKNVIYWKDFNFPDDNKITQELFDHSCVNVTKIDLDLDGILNLIINNYGDIK